MMPQDGSRHAWLAGRAPLDLIVTLDDATSEIYSAFLVEEEGTASTFRALKAVFAGHGLDRGSHYFHTPEAGGKVLPPTRRPRPGARLRHPAAGRALPARPQPPLRTILCLHAERVVGRDNTAGLSISPTRKAA